MQKTAAILFCTFPTLLTGQQILEWDAGGLPEVKLQTVQYRCYLPPDATFVRGVLVLIPGTHGDGRPLVNDRGWRSLAEKHHLAVVGCRFSDGDFALYQDDKKFVTCRSIEEAVRKFAEMSQHPEMARAPLAFWGMSAGSNLSARFCRFNPRRVLCFASSKGTRGPTRDKNGTEEIPMLFAVGAKDNSTWVENSLRNIASGVRKGAPWTLALHPEEGHGIGGSVTLARIYLDSIIQRRLAPPAEAGKTGRIKPVRRDDAWLGDPQTLKIFPFRDFPAAPSKGIYLPDEKTAIAWQKYLQG